MQTLFLPPSLESSKLYKDYRTGLEYDTRP